MTGQGTASDEMIVSAHHSSQAAGSSLNLASAALNAEKRFVRDVEDALVDTAKVDTITMGSYVIW